jgi:hypothetical protein
VKVRHDEGAANHIGPEPEFTIENELRRRNGTRYADEAGSIMMPQEVAEILVKTAGQPPAAR